MVTHSLARANVKSGICKRAISNTMMRTGPVSTESGVGIQERRVDEIACVAGFVPPTAFVSGCNRIIWLL